MKQLFFIITFCLTYSNSFEQNTIRIRKKMQLSDTATVPMYLLFDNEVYVKENLSISCVNCENIARINQKSENIFIITPTKPQKYIHLSLKNEQNFIVCEKIYKVVLLPKVENKDEFFNTIKLITVCD